MRARSVFLSMVSICIAMAQSPGTFTATGNMNIDRFSHTATLLYTGKVLIAGGFGAGAGSAELYDPATGVFTRTGDLLFARRWHTATMLANGKVLIAGDGPTAELYNPETGAFELTGNLLTARNNFTATLLTDGRVLIAGGTTSTERTGPGILASAELYDPATGMFTPAGEMTTARDFHTAVLLADGKVLIAASYDGPPSAWSSAEVYDPQTGTFTPLEARDRHYFDTPATLLANGNVLFAGGNGELTTTGWDTAELYDFGAQAFVPTGTMTTSRFDHTSTLLSDGTVLIAGSQRSGLSGGSALTSAELYDPTTGRFATTGGMISARFAHTATLLPDGTVLVAGGTANPLGGNGARAEIYHPAAANPAPVLLSLSGDGHGPGAILHGDTHEVVSTAAPARAGEVLEMYLTGLFESSVVPPRVAIGGRPAEVLYFGVAPGWNGLQQVNVRVQDVIEPGDAVTVRLVDLGRPSNEVTIAAR